MKLGGVKPGKMNEKNGISHHVNLFPKMVKVSQ
jgi:hypothetical protein